MALVVEDGTGKSDADSYLSETDADTYHTKYTGSTDWSGASSSEKEMALRKATQYLDAVYGRRWKGVRANEAQALHWPRSNAEDRDGVAIDDDDLPVMLERATAEAALRAITETNGLMPDISDPGDIKREKKKLDVIEKDTEYMGGKSPIKKFRVIDLLVGDLIEDRGVLSRM